MQRLVPGLPRFNPLAHTRSQSRHARFGIGPARFDKAAAIPT
jgi:hypothetical protein